VRPVFTPHLVGDIQKVNLFGTFVDAWMRPVADIGEAGTDQGKGGEYLFLPPGYEATVPEGGYFVFTLESYSINFACRPVHRGDGTLGDCRKMSYQMAPD
jgi:hypothetical protein